MSGFQFPPPPPPPPKPSNGDQNQAGQYGEAGRGRGRGRGRGGQDPRGRGGRGRGNFSQNRGQHQGSNGQSPPLTSTTSSYGQSHINTNTGASFNSSPQYGLNGTSGLPPGSYVNPAFHRNAFQNSTNQSNIQNGSQTSPRRTAAGHKRKLEALRGPQQDKKAGPTTAPLIPSFGNPILPANNASQSAQLPAPQSKRGPNMLGLTPQDDQPQYSSESEDDAIDEEAMYAELGTNLTFEHNGTVMALNTAADLAAWKNERLKNFPTKQRLAAKQEEKRQIGEERKRLLTEASQALRAAKDAKSIKTRVEVPTPDDPQTPSQPESDLEKARRELAVQTARLDQLRKSVAKSEDRAARARDQEAAGQEASIKALDGSSARDDEPNNKDLEKPGFSARDFLSSTAVIATSAQGNTPAAHVEDLPSTAEDAMDGVVAASQANHTAFSHGNSDDSDDDGPPEETTSTRQGTVNQNRRVCKYFAASGSCRDGDMCAFKHELDPRAAASMAQDQQRRDIHTGRHKADEQDETSPSSKRKTIYDRLLEQEQGQEDKLALQVIKYLGHMGLFAKKVEDTS
ncbi:hypothetical protein M409DRAFT_17154 [Zasmidium cellare ATCC 36951]|uniref:C3H1-type domain-containing protein n=1 Tax=Zasmidium cellare ATCC 36951 TaxID=1080233 RepID=A0A6A6D500_ZASCE|nr:uncharacterized protein M409DRAFT_17154 [Zasmidium cellare ATCC 36951]KAF2173209.1 hypothetical protein M409DRAFT_17154 [Zasmidium cellare ATCC 36951]